MIRKAHFKNFKILRQVCIDLQPFTVIVGPNSSGKTTILQALDCLTRCMSTEKQNTLRDTVFQDDFTLDLIKSREQRGRLELGCSGHLQDQDFSYSVTFDEEGFLPKTRLGEAETRGFEYLLRGEVSSAVFLRLDPKKLAEPSPKNVIEALPSDGEGLPALLGLLKLESLDRFEEISRQLREIVPGVRGITPRTSKSSKDIVFELLIDMEGADQVPAAALSEGTLLTLGLLTALSTQKDSRLVLIDDLERCLHPKALGTLIAQIRAVQELRPGLQIVATSHSPYLLDHFHAEEVLLTNCDADGYAVVKSLTEHPEYKEWKGFMATGEFWSSVGENWLTGAPVPRRQRARAR